MASRIATSGNTRRVLGTLGVLGAIGALATAGTYSLFTDSVTSSPQTISSGTFDIDDNGGVNTLAVTATDIAPGDTVQRIVDLRNNGGVGFQAVNMSIAAAPSTLLSSDATNGLQVQVDSCPVAWTPSGAAYTCASPTTIVSSRAVLAAIGSLGALNALTPAGVDHLRVMLTLPSTADNTFQGLSSDFTYTFAAIQRAGVAK